MAYSKINSRNDQLNRIVAAVRRRLQRLVNIAIRIIGSKYFLWGVIIFFVLQAMWIAFSFRYPMLYDEVFHVGVIRIFGHQLSPFIVNQPESYDLYGDLSTGGATIYHYLMSFPYRLISVISDNYKIQIIFLRILNILMAAGGLLLFSKLFKKVGIRQIFTNIALLIFILLPIVPFVAATVNYDNMLFILTAWYLILCVRILQSKKVTWYDYAWLVIVGCFASLAKYPFLPIFAISVIYLAIFVFKRYGRHFRLEFIQSLRLARRRTLITISIVLVITTGMFSAVYLKNIVLYGSPNPDCVTKMSEKRCLQNGVAKRALRLIASIDERPLQSPSSYANQWFNKVLRYAFWTGSSTAQGITRVKYMPILESVVFFSLFVAITCLAYVWRSLRKNSSWYFLIAISITLIAALFLKNYSSYLKYHAIIATQARYLLTVVPIMLVMSIVAINYIFKRRRSLKLIVLLIILFLFTQGGGIITHILKSEDSWYWQNQKVIEANHLAKKILQPLIKEN